jgi:hypothetical protein
MAKQGIESPEHFNRSHFWSLQEIRKHSLRWF